MRPYLALISTLIIMSNSIEMAKSTVNKSLLETESTWDFNLTVIVLTMNRPNSLARLLRSIRDTEMESDEHFFDLHIHVDKSIGGHYDDCVKLAKNFTLAFPKSTVKPRIAAVNKGLRAAWFEAWYPVADLNSFSLIIEDDIELSPFWYVWLRKAWFNYRNRSDIAGITLQRQFLMFKKPERSDLEVMNDHLPFLYKLVGTWAFSPHPLQWKNFLDWFHSLDSDNFDPYVPGLVTSDWLHMHNSMNKRHMTWIQWHVYFSEHNNLFTLYINLPNQFVLASNWREAGVHNRHSLNSKDYPTLNYCAIQLQEFPVKLNRYDWDLSLIQDEEEQQEQQQQQWEQHWEQQQQQHQEQQEQHEEEEHQQQQQGGDEEQRESCSELAY